MGALLLTLVVIVAVGSFALFVSITQSNAQNRSSFITNVQNEDLQVTSIDPAPDNATIQYQMSNSSGAYYIEIETPNTVTVINAGTGVASPVDLSYCLPNMICRPWEMGNLTQANYAWINSSTSGYLNLNLVPHQLVFVPSSLGNLKFETATWQNLTMTIRNLNTQNSGLSGVSVNAHDLLSWELLNQSGSVISIYTNSPPLVIAAKTSVTINVNLTGFNIPRTAAISILLLSSAYNFFTAVFSPPSSIVSASTTTENYLVATRDVPFFDGSLSNGSKPASIVSYIWQLEVPMTPWQQGNWGNVANVATIFAYGQSVQYRPEAFFSGFANLDLTGPLYVTLTTVDTNGLMAISQALVLPNDPNIAPAGSITGTVNSGTSCASGDEAVTVTVTNIYGQDLSGAPVLFLPGEQGFTVNPPFAVTNSNGQATTDISNCSMGEVLEVVSGNMAPIYVSLI